MCYPVVAVAVYFRLPASTPCPARATAIPQNDLSSVPDIFSLVGKRIKPSHLVSWLAFLPYSRSLFMAQFASVSARAFREVCFFLCISKASATCAAVTGNLGSITPPLRLREDMLLLHYQHVSCGSQRKTTKKERIRQHYSNVGIFCLGWLSRVGPLRRTRLYFPMYLVLHNRS